jgi:hypothetical protein
MNQPARQKPRGEHRAFEQALGSASVLLVLAILVMVNYLAFRHYLRLDWTSEGIFTLSPKSVKVLSGLEQDVELYLFLSQGEPAFETTDELVKRYKALSPHVVTHVVDPDRQPGQFKLLAQRFGVLSGVTETGESRADVAVVVVQGEKNWHVNREDLSGFDMGGGADGDEQLNVKAEQALTGAIVQVTSGRSTKVCVTQGHGEWSVDEGGGERSLASLKTGLRHDNLEWQAFPTLGKKEVPKDCDAVFVLGPTRAFSESEAKLILDYVRGGGNAWIALDPVIEHDEILPTGFEDQLKSVGVRIDRSLAIELDPEHLLSPNTVEFVVTEFGDHVTTRALKDRARIVAGMARSLSVVQQSENIEVLFRTSDKAFGATDISQVLSGGKEPVRGPNDIAGPLDLGLAVQVRGADSAQKPGGRLIVTGDSDFLQAAALESPELANFHLASAFTGWLTEREALIEIPPKKVKGGAIMFTQEDLTALLFRVGVLLPGAALLLGVAVWFNRRS